jgi:hypothetical protein
MKRVIFIICWIAAFTTLGLFSNWVFGKVGVPLERQVNGGPTTFTGAGIACLAIFLGLPLLALILGLVGNLPGTARRKSQSDTVA